MHRLQRVHIDCARDRKHPPRWTSQGRTQRGWCHRCGEYEPYRGPMWGGPTTRDGGRDPTRAEARSVPECASRRAAAPRLIREARASSSVYCKRCSVCTASPRSSRQAPPPSTSRHTRSEMPSVRGRPEARARPSCSSASLRGSLATRTPPARATLVQSGLLGSPRRSGSRSTGAESGRADDRPLTAGTFGSAARRVHTCRGCKRDSAGSPIRRGPAIGATR